MTLRATLKHLIRESRGPAFGATWGKSLHEGHVAFYRPDSDPLAEPQLDDDSEAVNSRLYNVILAWTRNANDRDGFIKCPASTNTMSASEVYGLAGRAFTLNVANPGHLVICRCALTSCGSSGATRAARSLRTRWLSFAAGLKC